MRGPQLHMASQVSLPASQQLSAALAAHALPLPEAAVAPHLQMPASQTSFGPHGRQSEPQWPASVCVLVQRLPQKSGLLG